MPRYKEILRSGSLVSRTRGNSDLTADEARDALRRLAGPSEPNQQDLRLVPQLSDIPQRTRIEKSIKEAKRIAQNYDTISPHFKTMKDGLNGFGWNIFPNKCLGTGGFGGVLLAYQIKEDDFINGKNMIDVKSIVGRMMTAVKIQKPAEKPKPMRMSTNTDSGSHSRSRNSSQMDANYNDIESGYNIVNELFVLEAVGHHESSVTGGIPEVFALHYVKQIASGLKYLHSKQIVHRDLHQRNILLKYRNDYSKVCMIADFGFAVLMPHPDVACVDRKMSLYAADISNLIFMIQQMLGLYGCHDPDIVSPEARDLCDYLRNPPTTVDQLLKHKWFSLESKPYFAKDMTVLRTPAEHSMPSSLSRIRTLAAMVPEQRHRKKRKQRSRNETPGSSYHLMQFYDYKEPEIQEHQSGHQHHHVVDVHDATSRPQGNRLRRTMSRMSQRIARAGRSLNCFRRRS